MVGYLRFLKKLTTVVIHQNRVFGFLRISVMNPNNHPDNLGQSVPISNDCPILVPYHTKLTLNIMVIAGTL
jgi:hypothetical protein